MTMNVHVTGAVCATACVRTEEEDEEGLYVVHAERPSRSFCFACAAISEAKHWQNTGRTLAALQGQPSSDSQVMPADLEVGRFPVGSLQYYHRISRRVATTKLIRTLRNICIA